MRGRAVVIKNIEIEEEIPAASIPVIEEILAGILFAAWRKERAEGSAGVLEEGANGGDTCS